MNLVKTSPNTPCHSVNLESVVPPMARDLGPERSYDTQACGKPPQKQRDLQRIQKEEYPSLMAKRPI